MIDPKKQYRTRDGEEVRIYAVDGDEEMPIHGAILTEHGWKVNSWGRDGKWCPNSTYGVDLIEVKPRIKREVWVNVYPAWLQSDVMYQSKKAADDGAAPDRIACVKLVIDCEEGEGL
jgi:hypothetical protein